MKRFYGLLFVIAALLSGNVYGMEREVDIRDYADVVKHLTTTSCFMEQDDFEGLAITALPAIENFIIANNKQDEKQYARLCASYLNKVFTLRECDAEQVEKIVRERFIGNSPLALFYSLNRQEIVSQLNISKIEPKIKQEGFDQLLDLWLPILDGSGNILEYFILAQLDHVMLKYRLDVSFLRYVKTRLENLHCAQEKQDAIARNIESLTENLRKSVQARIDDMTRQIVGFLKQNDDTKLNDLLRQEFVTGDDTSLFGYGDLLNKQVQNRINFEQRLKKITNGNELLQKWETVFNNLSVLSQSQQQRDFGDQMSLEYQALRPEIVQKDLERKKVSDQQEVQRNLEKHQQELLARQTQERQALEEQQHHAEVQRRQNQTVEERREEQRRQFLEQEQERQQRNQVEEQRRNQRQQPDLGGPDANAPKGLAAIFACISAPKLVVAAVVVGVCYWGYTKYKAYKAAQQEKDSAVAKEAMADKQEKNNPDMSDKEQSAHNKKQNVRNKQRAR